MRLIYLFMLAILLCTSRWAASADELLSFDSPEQRELFTALTHEYRCLKCQNQTIASSNADLADDLRNEIHAMVLQGKSRQEIDTYLLDRYGDFVLYKPRFKASTVLLWLGPFALLLLALWIALRTAREKNSAEKNLDPTQLDKARSLLKKSP